MRKKYYQMNTCRRKYYIEKKKRMSYGPFKDQTNTHKRRYYTETENNTLLQQTILEDSRDPTKINCYRKFESFDKCLQKVKPC